MKRFSHGGASATIRKVKDGVFRVANVWSEDRGKGDASAVMRKIVEYADQHELYLKLEARQYGDHPQPSLTDRQLQKFYEKYGFKTDSPGRPITMTREPSQEKHAP